MGKISEYKPGSEIVHLWEATTGLPWDPFDSCAVNTQRDLICPKCDVIMAARLSAYVLGLVTSLSKSVHSLPCARKDWSGTKRFYLLL